MPEPHPEFDLRLYLEPGASIRPHLAQVLKAMGRRFSIRIVSITPANEVARALVEAPLPTFGEFRGKP